MKTKITYNYTARYFNNDYTHYFDVKLTGRYRYVKTDGVLIIEVEIRVPRFLFLYQTMWVNGDHIDYVITEISEIFKCEKKHGNIRTNS